MTLTATITYFESLINKNDKKSEIKVYNCFIGILSSLKKRDLTINQSKLIQEKLSSLNLEATTKNRKKYYKLKLSEFKAFLKNEFSFTTEKYYTELGMIYGMSIGVSVGISIGIAINPTLGISIGLSIGTGVGMVLGMIYGARKDTEAKRQGKVI